MFPGRRGGSVCASSIESCRSYGAWLNSWGCAGYNMALLRSLTRRYSRRRTCAGLSAVNCPDGRLRPSHSVGARSNPAMKARPGD